MIGGVKSFGVACWRWWLGASWHDPFKLDRFGCEYFLLLIGETTHEAQGKQTASPLKTIDAVTMEKDPIVAWAIKHPIDLRKTESLNQPLRGQPHSQSNPVFGVPSQDEDIYENGVCVEMCEGDE